jgi:Family of unknown function (DUF5996)
MIEPMPVTLIWPDIPYDAWRETCSALHLYTQIPGKYRLARTPWLNHSWHATLYLNARGLTTSPIPDAPGATEIAFDLIDHTVIGTASDRRRAGFPLGPMSVAEFHARVVDMISLLGGTPEFDGRPNEVPDPVPFREDRLTRPYDAEAVVRFFRALVAIEQVFYRLYRQGQSRASLLGQLRPRGDPLLRTCRPAPPGRHPGTPGRGNARGL